MKRSVIIGVVAIVVVIVGAVVAIVSMNTTSPSAKAPTPSAGFSAKIVDACKVLTTGVAALYLGSVPQASDTPASVASSGDIDVSDCSYSTKVAAGDSAQSVSLLVRSAKTVDGADSNAAQFNPLPSGTKEVSGYGDKAYWDPGYGQLNILKNHNWYIISAGDLRPTDRTADDAQKLADMIIKNL